MDFENLLSVGELADLERLRDTGVVDIHGKKVREGDWVRTHMSSHMFKLEDICKVAFQDGAYGIIWKSLHLSGDVTEFRPFCTICNTEYEILTPEEVAELGEEI